MKIVVALVVISFFSSLAYGQCEREKKRADKWNNILKAKVTERARTGHREAKADYLDCIRQQKKERLQPKSSTYTTNKPQKSPRAHYKFSPRRESGHVTVTDYTNFKGKKRRVWNQYFTESDECLSNKKDMKIFVACAKVRKRSLKAFNARWNAQTQELRPLLDSD